MKDSKPAIHSAPEPREAARTHPASTPAGRSTERDAFPLSPAQERIWHAHRQQPVNTVYNGSFRMNLAGFVDPVLIERTFNEIVRRHEILRATIEISKGEPLQVIAPSLSLKLAFTDLRSSPGDTREAEMDAICVAEAQLPFDLEKSPLLRVGLIRMEDQRNILMLTIHQIICDGWSIGLMMEELQKIYAAFAAARPSPLPPLAIQYGDYVIWQRETSAGPESIKQLNYWKKRLRGCRRLELCCDLPAVPACSFKSAILSHLLPLELTNKLREFSNAQGATFFITTLAACLTLLFRYTGREDLSLGSPLAGRNRTDLEGLVGQFVNHIMLRADAAGDPLFPEFVSRVRESVWEAFANQDVPFENVLKALHPGQDPYRDPLYTINFICQREYGRAATFNFDFSGIRMSTMPSKSQGAMYDLNFFLVEREAGWRLSLEYKTELYKEETAKQLLGHFKELLESISVNPNRRLSQLPLTGKAPVPPSVFSPADEIYAMPASPGQQRFWLLAQLDRTNPSFHMPACVRLSGPLSHGCLEKSFLHLVQRHESLRTTFEEIDDELAQIISPARSFSLPTTDLSSVPAAQRDARLQQLIQEEASRSFDLEKGPLLRAHLFRLSENDHALLTVIHHILADGWSQRVIQDDLWAVYAALSENRQPSLVPLAIQYSDFTAWQKDWLDSSEAQEHLEFWKKKLSGDLPILDFPTDRPPSNRPASRGAIETLLLPEDLTTALRSWSKSQNVTVFTVMLSAFAVLLSRASKLEDVLIGSPVANRRPETEPLIGPFAGPVCLRIDLSGNPALQEVVSRVRDVTIDALSHTDLPFEVLLDNIKVRTIDGRKPLFQFYFFYQAAFLQPRQVGPLQITPLSTFSVGIPFELQLGIIERQEGLRAQLEYNPDLFDEPTIQKVLDSYESILRSMLQNSNQS